MFTQSQLHSLYRYCYSLCHHSDDAYDLLQSALEKYLNVDAIKISNAEAYVRGCARNLFIDECRHKKIVLLESIEDQHEIVAAQENLESLMFDEAEINYLMDALHPFEREVLFLSCVLGYSAEEISQQQDVSRNTVLSRLHRTKKKAEKILSQSRDNNSVQVE